MTSPDDSYDPAAASHRALRGVKRELERHPAVASVRGFPSSRYTQVVGDIAIDQLDVDVDDATLTVRWYAGDTAMSPPEFSFHYSDSTGDIGWHHHPQDHVDGWGHVQERAAAESTYTYESYSFASTQPTRVVWEVLSVLTATLQSR